MSHYTMLSKYGNCTSLLKIKNKVKIGYFYKYSQEKILHILDVFNTTIIPLALIDYSQLVQLTLWHIK